MEEASASGGALSQNQKLFLQQQQQQQQRQQQQQHLLLLQHYQKQQLQMQQQHQQQYSKHLQQLQQQQQIMSRFPSNIDAHLRPPGLRSIAQPRPPQNPPLQQQASVPPQQQQASVPPQQQQQQPKGPPSVAAGNSGLLTGMVGRQASQTELELAQQDAWKVCNPDIRRPFLNVEDAVHRLLPYHIVADYEAEEDDRILDNDTTGQVPSRLQQWDSNVLAKLGEFTSTFEKQVLALNIMSRKRALGEFRAEERLMIEQVLLQEEKQAMLLLRAEAESREKAEREAAEAKMRMAMVQAEHSRTEVSARSVRASECSANDPGDDHDPNIDEGMPAWGYDNQRDEEPSEDYLNDENEPENDDNGAQGEWGEVGELDLNTR